MMQTTLVITKLRKTEIHIGSKSRGVKGPTQWDSGFLKDKKLTFYNYVPDTVSRI